LWCSPSNNTQRTHFRLNASKLPTNTPALKVMEKKNQITISLEGGRGTAHPGEKIKRPGITKEKKDP